MASGTTATLLEVWGLDETHVYATGASGAMLRFDGTRWSPMTNANGPTEIWGIWGSSPTNLVAVGQNGAILRSDGSAWTRDDEPRRRPRCSACGAARLTTSMPSASRARCSTSTARPGRSSPARRASTCSRSGAARLTTCTPSATRARSSASTAPLVDGRVTRRRGRTCARCGARAASCSSPAGRARSRAARAGAVEHAGHGADTVRDLDIERGPGVRRRTRRSRAAP